MFYSVGGAAVECLFFWLYEVDQTCFEFMYPPLRQGISEHEPGLIQVSFGNVSTYKYNFVVSVVLNY